MGNSYSHINGDIIGIILKIVENPKYIILCKGLYTMALNSGKKCDKCNKSITIFYQPQWVTDPDDPICHGGYKDLDYYRNLKKIVSIYPDFLINIKRQCSGLCNSAVKTDGLAIRYVYNQTPALCELAIARNPDAIAYIKNPTESMCILAIKTALGHNLSRPPLGVFFGINYFNPNAQTCYDKICGEINFQIVSSDALTCDGNLLKYIPEKLQTYTLCSIAIKQNPDSFRYISSKYQYDDIWTYALSKDIHNFKFIYNPQEKHYIELFKLNPEYFKIYINCMGMGIRNNNEGNTAFGHHALVNMTTGNNNLASGYGSGFNIFGTNNNISIGNMANVHDDGVIRIGNIQHKNFQAGIYGSVIERGAPVFVSPSGQLGTCT